MSTFSENDATSNIQSPCPRPIENGRRQNRQVDHDSLFQEQQRKVQMSDCHLRARVHVPRPGHQI